MTFTSGVVVVVGMLVMLVMVVEGVQVALDLSKLTDPQHLQAMEELTISTFLAVPTTTTFTLLMNQAAMTGMSHLLNGSVETPESSQQQQQQQQQRHKEQQEKQLEEGLLQHPKAGKSLFSITKASGLPDVGFTAHLAGAEGSDMGAHLLAGKGSNLGTHLPSVEGSHLGAHLLDVEGSDLGTHPPGVEDFRLGAQVAVVADVGAHVLGVNDSDLGIHQTHGENTDLNTSRSVEDTDAGAHIPQVEELWTHTADVEESDVEAHLLGVEGSSLGDHLSGVGNPELGAHLVDLKDSNLRVPLSGVNGSSPENLPVGGKDSGLGAHPPGVESSNLRDHVMGVKDIDLHAHLPDVEDTDYGAQIAGVEDSELWACMAGLSKENVDVVKTLVSKEAEGLLLKLTPTDEEFPDILELMYTLKTCRWYPRSSVPQPKVEALEVGQMIPEEVEQRLKEVTSWEEVEAGRGASHGTTSPMQVDLQHLTHMLGSVFSITRNHETAPLDKLVATLYISRKFDSFGLMVVNHVFSAAEYSLWFDEHLQGTNVIGVLAGRNWGTAADEPLVLGAHLDTVPGTPGLDDDGSGLAALVEAARVLSSSGCIFTHTIIFVAFDLEEIGTQGSLVFVKDYLTSAIMDKFGIRRVTGAFILDCVSNWDPQPGTQDFPETWSNLLPDAGRSLAQRNYTGDFAAIIYRTQVDGHLAHRFAQYYRGLDQPEYRLELLGLKELGADLPDMSLLKTHFDFLRSDHLRFWYLNDTAGSYDTIPAVLLTDTGPFRGMMRQCYHGACDGPLAQDKDNLGLLAKVTQAVVWTMSDLARAQCGPRGTAVSTPTLFNFLGTVH